MTPSGEQHQYLRPVVGRDARLRRARSLLGWRWRRDEPGRPLADPVVHLALLLDRPCPGVLLRSPARGFLGSNSQIDSSHRRRGYSYSRRPDDSRRCGFHTANAARFGAIDRAGAENRL